MAFNRRDFVRLSLLTSGFLFSSSAEIKALNSVINKSKNSPAFGGIDGLLTEARKAFYKGEYDNARDMYRSIIGRYTDDIRGYDGMRRVLNADHKFMEVAEMYRIALRKNPGKPEFYDRMGVALRRLATGNIKQSITYINKYGEDQLLEKAAELYIKALEIDRDATYLKKGLRDVHECIESVTAKALANEEAVQFNDNTLENIERLTDGLKEKPVTSLDLTQLKDEELKDLYKKTGNRKRRTLYFDKEKNNRETGIKKLRKRILNEGIRRFWEAEDFDRALKMCKRVYKLNPDDSTNYQRLTVLFKKLGKYDELVHHSRERLYRSHTFWNKLGLAKNLMLYYHKVERDQMLLKEAKYICEDLTHYTNELSNEQIAGAFHGLVKCHVVNKDYDEALHCYEVAAKRMQRPSDYVAATMCVGVAKCKAKCSGNDEGISALKYFLDEGREDDERVKKIKAALPTMKRSKKKNLLLYHYMADLNAKKGDRREAKRIYKQILKEQPKDKLATRKMKKL